MTRVSQFDPKTSESHDTREISDLKTAADHQLWNKNRSGSSTLEHKCVSVVKKGTSEYIIAFPALRRGSAPDPPVDTVISFLPLLEPFSKFAVRELIKLRKTKKTINKNNEQPIKN